MTPMLFVPLMQNIVTLSLITLCGVSMAELTWWGVAGFPLNQHVAVYQPVVERASTTNTTVAAASLSPLAALHLFGTVDRLPPVVKAAPVAPQPTVAVDTSLNLTLKGIFFTSGAGEGRALIAEGRGNEEVYQIGDTIAGQAIVYAIAADHVVLDRNGQLERLSLPQQSDSGFGATTGQPDKGRSTPSSRNRAPSSRFTPPTGRGPRSGSSDATHLGELRQQLLKDPSAAMGLAKVRPVMSAGKMLGYSINPGSNPDLFAELGLQAGDLVKEVNGIAVTDPAKMGDVLNQLTTSTALSVTIERNGQVETLSINF